MTILHITKKYPPLTGGDAVVVLALQKQQKAAGHKVVVLTSKSKQQSRDVYGFGLADTSAGLDAITLRRLVSLCMLSVSIFAIIRRERPDVIHTHSVDIACVVALAARLFRIPIVHTFHIVTFYHNGHIPLRQHTELWLLRFARPQVVTAPNAFDVSKLQAAGFGQTRLLPNGVDARFWQQPPAKRTNKTFVFVAFGRLEKQKGYSYLLRAASCLARQSVPAFRLVIVGGGSQAKLLHELCELLQLKHHVQLVGEKSSAHIRELLASADAAVFASLYETTPITLLEAWAAGVPTIATRVGILQNKRSHFSAALIVPPADEQALTQAMVRCMSDEPLRRKLARRGRTEAQKYAWSVIAKTAEALYQGDG